MSKNIRISEPSAEMQTKIQKARRAIASQKMRMVRPKQAPADRTAAGGPGSMGTQPAAH